MLLEVAVISTKPQKLNSILPHCSYCDGDRNSLDLNCPSKKILNYKPNPVQSIPAPNLSSLQ